MTATFQEIHAAVEDHFRNEIATVLSLPTHYANVAFTPPVDRIWCDLTIDEDDRSDGAIMRPRNLGAMVAVLYSPAGTGTGAAYAVAKNIAVEFDRLRLIGPPDIRFGICQPDPIGDTGHGYWQINVTCEFRSDED